MRLPLTLATLGLLSGCTSLAYRSYDPRPRAEAPADVAGEIGRLAEELTERAALRTPLGSARVVVDDLVPLEPRSHRYRQATLERQLVRDTQTTLRNELEIALSDRMNVVGGTVLSGSAARTLEERASSAQASHAVVGTFQRDGRDVALVVQLIDLRSDWLVASARRTIERFEADAFATPVIVASAEGPGATGAGGDALRPVPEPLSSIGVAEREAPTGGDGEPRPDAAANSGSGSPAGAAPPDPARATGEPAGDVPAGTSADIPVDVELAFDKGPAASRLRAVNPALIGELPADPDSGQAPRPVESGPKLPD